MQPTLALDARESSGKMAANTLSGTTPSLCRIGLRGLRHASRRVPVTARRAYMQLWWRVSRVMAALAFCCATVLATVEASAQEALQSGEAIVTRFSGTMEQAGSRIIDPDGAVARILDLRQPGGPPEGAHWFNEVERAAVTAGEIGQVFGVALDDATPPNIYLTATSAFGLHRNADNSDWMPGMWGANGGPGTVWKLDAANGYRPEIFAQIGHDGRANSGAALGNIAFDARNRQFYVSDLETGMIHRLRLADGADLGTFDHGGEGRTAFLDVPTGEFRSLPAVTFDPGTAARIADCPSGDFSRTPSCWNFADFRRRAWGLGVRLEPASEQSRLYYAVWSSQGFGNPDYASANENEQRNSLWSVAIAADGSFDLGSVRREFSLPEFFRSPEAIARVGRSHPVSDIAFPAYGNQSVMLVAERGGVRNLSLAAENAFAYPHEARVLRYELTDAGSWRGAGRYDVGYYDRSEDGPPYMRANSAGGVSFGPGYGQNWEVDHARPDGFVWMTGDGLCSPRGLCFDSSARGHTDSSQVNGIQGRAARPYEAFEPITAFQPYPSPGPVTPPIGPDSSFMVDADINTDANGNAIETELQRNDATRVGDVAVFQLLPGKGEALPPTEPEIAGWPEGLPPEGWLPAPPPADGWFLPPPILIDTDLAIRKTGPAACQEGVECSYTVTIRNLGAVAYVGPLAIADTMPVGATLASTSPGWHCTPIGVSFNCITNAPALLVPGATAAIEVNLLLAADVPGPTVQNCAAIDWYEMGTDDGPGDGNDEDCVDTPVTEGFDLGIIKDTLGNCVESADCTFVVQVVNYGPGEFNGVVAVRDPLPAGSSLSLAGFELGPGTCVPTAGAVRCLTPELTLPVGGTLFIVVAINLPDGIAGGTVENCANIDWAAMTANDGAADAHPDEACRTVNVLDNTGYFDLSVAKQGPDHCSAGGNCNYQIIIANNGPDTYTGEVVVQDTPEPGVTYVGASAGWACGPGVPIDCTLLGGPHTLHPGETRTLTLTVAIPDPAPANPMLNCLAINWGAGGMPPNDNPAPGSIDKPEERCAPTYANDGFDLEIAKTGPGECYEGGGCDFTVSVTNNGPAPFLGLRAITDTLPADSTLEGVTDATFCNSMAAGTVTCNVADLAPLPPGGTHEITVHTRLPDPVIGDTVENCAALDWDAPPPGWYIGPTFTGDGNAANDGPACATVPVLAADLAPWGATTCQLGASCPIEVKVENRGGRLFKGAAGLRGTLDPGVTISSIESRTAGFDCRVTGTGLYECNGRDLTIKPGAAAEFRLVLEIPENFPYQRIVHRKEMLWPDTKVKDPKPENDRHTSTIMILQPDEPAAPPTASVSAADLAVKKSAARDACIAGAPCDFLITVTNVSRTTYTGPLQLRDVVAPGGARLDRSGSSAWSCRESGGEFLCSSPTTSLRPGETRTLSLTLDTSRMGAGAARNCASLDWSERARIMAVQNALDELGFAVRPVDGQVGSKTRNAIADYQKSTGQIATGQIDTALLRRLFVNWGVGDANAANDNSCTTVTIRQPIVAPPVCVAGQKQIDPSQLKVLRAQGWKITPVTRGGQTIYCGVPPAPLACPPGYKAYRDKDKIPPNSDVLRQQRGDQVLFCARPQPISCPPGYEAYSSRNRVPKGWEMITRRSDGQVLYCARPPKENCPRGWKQIDPARAAALALQGWQIRRVGSLTCARPGETTTPPTPVCTGGRVWNAKQKSCVCPLNMRWNPKQNRCVLQQIQQPGLETPQLQRGVIPPLQRILPQPLN